MQQLYSNYPMNNSIQHLKVHQTFAEAYQHLRICYHLKIIYLLSKIVLVFYLWDRNIMQDVDIWMGLLLVISIAQFSFFMILIMELRKQKIKLKIAFKLGYVFKIKQSDAHHDHQVYYPYIFIQYQLQTSTINQLVSQDAVQRQIKILSFKIESVLQKSTVFIDRFFWSQMFLYQLVQVFGIYILSYGQINCQKCRIFIISVLYIGTYQYIEYYLCFLLGIIYYSVKIIQQICYKTKIKWKTYRTNYLLKSMKFQLVNDGDTQCSICLQEFSCREAVVKLKCNERHHFHFQCIKQWILTSTTCPVCRADIYQNSS